MAEASLVFIRLEYALSKICELRLHQLTPGALDRVVLSNANILVLLSQVGFLLDELDIWNASMVDVVHKGCKNNRELCQWVRRYAIGGKEEIGLVILALVIAGLLLFFIFLLTGRGVLCGVS